MVRKKYQEKPLTLEGLKRAREDRDNWPVLMREHFNKSNMPKIVDWIGKAVREYWTSTSLAKAVWEEVLRRPTVAPSHSVLVPVPSATADQSLASNAFTSSTNE